MTGEISRQKFRIRRCDGSVPVDIAGKSDKGKNFRPDRSAGKTGIAAFAVLLRGRNGSDDSAVPAMSGCGDAARLQKPTSGSFARKRFFPVGGTGGSFGDRPAGQVMTERSGRAFFKQRTAVPPTDAEIRTHFRTGRRCQYVPFGIIVSRRGDRFAFLTETGFGQTGPYPFFIGGAGTFDDRHPLAETVSGAVQCRNIRPFAAA